MKKLNRNILILVGLFVFLTVGFPVKAAEIIVNVTGARVRSAPNLKANVLGMTKIGTIYTVLKRQSGWYNIDFKGTKSGWISDTISGPFDNTKRGSIYQSIAAKYFKRATLDFDTASELFEFLTNIQPQVKNSNVEPELAYYRLLALAKTIEIVPFDKYEQSPFKDFLKKYEAEIVYSEPSGEYAVLAGIWWDLREKYSKNPIADEIAWQGAMTIIPGECEGYVVCHLYNLRETDAKYLEFYPNGKYSGQALKNAADYLEGIAGGASGSRDDSGYFITPDPDDRVQLEKYVSELRTIISETSGTAKTKILSFLDETEAGYRPKPFDETGLDVFWESFRTAVINNDKTSVADMTQFPLSMPYGNDEIKSRAEFLRNYDEIMNIMADAAKCFEKESLTKENGRYGVYCGFKNESDDNNDNKPNYYYFAKTETGWKFAGIDNINE